MAVSSHLKIALPEYDARIRTFIPDYEEMLDAAAASLVAAERPSDGGGGPRYRNRRATVARGRRGAQCRADWHRRRRGHAGDGRPTARGPGSTADRRGLRARRDSTVRRHHRVVRASSHRAAPQQEGALCPGRARRFARGGVLVSADCHPPANAALAAAGRDAWHAHLADSYGPRKAESFLQAWAGEDFYVPLDVELALLQSAGFTTDVSWRKGAFAVIVARAGRARRG